MLATARGRWTPYWFLLPAIGLLAVFQLAPIAIALVGSLFSENIRGETMFEGFANYADLVSNPEFWNSLRVTLIFNAVVNPLQIGLALGLALLVFGTGFGVRLFRTAFFIPMTVSMALVAVLWGLLLDPNIGLVNGLLNSVGIPSQPFFHSPDQALGSIVGITTWKGVGYWMLFLLAGLYAIPHELYEAAAIDGASGFRRFTSITLPLLKRVLVFVLVADTAINFLLFAPIYLITSGGPLGSTDLLMYRAYQAAFVFLDSGAALATSTIILVIAGIVVAFEFRLLRSGDD